jgi:hypothetical protein
MTIGGYRNRDYTGIQYFAEDIWKRFPSIRNAIDASQLRITGVELNPHLTAAEAIPLMAADFYSITATRVPYGFSIHETLRRDLCSAVPPARLGARA